MATNDNVSMESAPHRAASATEPRVKQRELVLASLVRCPREQGARTKQA